MRLELYPWTPPRVLAIPLRRRDGSTRAFAWIDSADAHLAEHRWHWHDGYAACVEKGQRRFLHREILDLKPGDPAQGDHRSRMRSDNRRANLRVTDQDGNAQNRSPNRECVSIYRGVSFIEGRWFARMRDRTVGFYATELDAAKAAARARKREMPWSTEPVSLLSGPDPEPARSSRQERFHQKALKVERWWADGWSLADISAALGMKHPAGCGALVANMRRHGYAVPYRKPRGK